MSERKAVSVRIAGEEHTIRANAEPEYTRACARYVDTRIADIRSKGLIETHRATILAALSISDELFQARDELERLRQDVASRATGLARRLRETVEAPAAAESGPATPASLPQTVDGPEPTEPPEGEIRPHGA